MSWVQQYDGKPFDYARISSNETPSPQTLAFHLADIHRWTGAARSPISVAEHSLNVVGELDFVIWDGDKTSKLEIPPNALKFMALMHDAAEWIMGDVNKPLKELLPDYRALYKRVENWLFAKYGLTEAFTSKDAQLIKQADERQLFAEKFFFLNPTQRPWSWDRKFAVIPRRWGARAEIADAWLQLFLQLQPSFEEYINAKQIVLSLDEPDRGFL